MATKKSKKATKRLKKPKKLQKTLPLGGGPSHAITHYGGKLACGSWPFSPA